MSNDLAGWTTKCPGCKELIPVPSLEKPAPLEVERVPASVPWKGIAIGASAVAVVAIIAAIASAGGPSEAEIEASSIVAQLKKQLAAKNREIDGLATGGDQSAENNKLRDRVQKSEAERDLIQKQLEVTQRRLEEYRLRVTKAEAAVASSDTPSNPPASEIEPVKESDPPQPPPPAAKSPEPAAKDPALVKSGPPAPVAKEPENPEGIKIGSFVPRMIVDDERDRIIGIDTARQGVFVASISKNKVIRTILTGSGPTDVQVTVSSDIAWVGHPDAGNLVKISLDDGKVYDRVNVVSGFQNFAATRHHIWLFGQGNSGLVTNQTKQYSNLPIRFGSLVWDRKRDRLIGITLGLGDSKMIDFDPDKCGPLLRDIHEIRTAGPSHDRYKELPDLVRDFDSRKKSWVPPAECAAWMVGGFRFAMVVNKAADRVYMNRSILKRDKLDTIEATFPPFPYKTPHHGDVTTLLDSFAMEATLIQCGSPDGKWIATGTHIYSAQNLTMKKELPIPTPTSGFSSDSKTLYIYDARSHSILPLKVD